MEKNSRTNINQATSLFYHLFVFSDCECEVVVCFVDNGEIDDYLS